MLTSNGQIRITYPGQPEELDIFGGGMAVHSDATNLPLMLAEHVAPPGYGVPLHVHEHDDEVFVVLEGELTVVGPQGETCIGPGASVELPRGVPHGFRNDAAAPARLLVLALPGRYALDMFRHFDRVGKGPSPLSPVDLPVIARHYGVRFL